MRRSAILLAGLLCAAAWPQTAGAVDKVKFQLSWRPQAEHGCYYQGIAAGIYARHGLDVTVEPGGPQINTQQILVSGKVEFAMGSNSFNGFNYVRENIPMVVIAAVFQKDPQGLLAHVGVGHDTLASLKGDTPVYVSGISRSTWWPFLRTKYGFVDEQLRPYTFNMAPFLNDKTAAQQGFVTNEPYQAELAGTKVNFFLLADHGYDDYAYTVETSKELVAKNPDLVQRFVNATIEGCYSYLSSDSSAANKLILEANPQMTQEIIANSIKMMKEKKLMDGLDAETLGIGSMTDARWASFFETTVKAGLYPGDLDFKRGYSLQFVNKRHGLVSN